MTRNEINLAKSTLPKRCNIPWHAWTKQQKRLDNELSCREMINSCLVYNGIQEFWREFEDFFGKHSYADQYVKVLGIERVKELVKEQEADFSKAVVLRNVFTDSEGLSYNSVRWADDVST